MSSRVGPNKPSYFHRQKPYPYPISCDVTTKKQQLLAVSLYTSATTLGDNMTACIARLDVCRQRLSIILCDGVYHAHKSDIIAKQKHKSQIKMPACARKIIIGNITRNCSSKRNVNLCLV